MDSTIPQDDTPRKKCTGPCGRFLPVTAEFFHRQSTRFHPKCKECRNAQKRAEHARPEQRAKDNARSKAYQQAHNEQIKGQKRMYHESHKEQAKAYHQAHRQHRLEYNKAWHRVHREQERERRKLYYEVHQEQEKTYQRAYIKANPLQNRKGVHVYRARKRGNGGKYTPAQIEEQLKRQKHRCYYAACGHAKFKIVNGRHQYHIDHVIPLVRGGRNDISNIVLACPSCNDKKHAKLPHEWPEGGRLL